MEIPHLYIEQSETNLAEDEKKLEEALQYAKEKAQSNIYMQFQRNYSVFKKDINSLYLQKVTILPKIGTDPKINKELSFFYETIVKYFDNSEKPKLMES